MKLASDVVIKLDGVDITDRVLYQRTTFNTQANPISGSFKVAVKDPQRDFSPTAGSQLTCHIDGVSIQGGYVKRISRGNFFPVVNTSQPVKTRLWGLQGPDYNTLFDYRVIRDYTHFDRALPIPATKRTITKALRYFLSHYIDIPPGLGYSRRVDSIKTGYGDSRHGGLYVQQGQTWRAQMEDFADNGGLIYYIDADLELNLHE